MFTEKELLEYDKEFNKLKIEISQEQRKEILDFMYSLSVIAYEYYNNKEINSISYE